MLKLGKNPNLIRVQYFPNSYLIRAVRFVRENLMPKRAVIEISLIKEADEKPNEEIKKQILQFLKKYPPKIPWFKNVEKVTVTEV